MSKAADAQVLLQTLQAAATPAAARADFLIYNVTTHGLDMRPAVAQLIQEADEGRQLKAKAAEEERQPLFPEIFVGRVEHNGQPLALVTNGAGEVCLPAEPDQLDALDCGDPVLVDQKRGRIAGPDGAVPQTGDVVTVESVPPDDPEQVVVQHRGQSVVARLPRRLLEAAGPPRVGSRMTFDPVRRFVLSVLDTESDGRELLADPATLSKFSRADLGAAHPALDQMLFRLKAEVLFPEWARRLRARQRTSYLLVGATGTGKTTHIKVLARELTDFVEELTGERVSRLVLCDASTFYSPWFGETEAKIRAWFERLHRLGSVVLRTRDGREVRVPLLIVLEEVEALFRSRGEFGGSSHLFDRPLALLLQLLDSLTDTLDVPLLFCSTTNRPDLLDAAGRRRLGVRQILFGTLTAPQAASVLAKKVPPDLPLRGGDRDPERARAALLGQVLSYLYGGDPEQGVAEVRLVSGERRTLCRRDLVTGAMLEQATSTAIDECFRHSAEAGELLGLDGDGILRSLQEQFATLAATLRPHNLREHCPEWFSEEMIRVEAVVPLARQRRRPRSLFVRT
jgi:hypothetical protein